MQEKEWLKKLIDEYEKPTINEWAYEVESFLQDSKNETEESKELIRGIKLQADAFFRCENLRALLKRLYKKKYDSISIPQVTKRNQIFVAMMFSDETDIYYEEAYKPIIQMMNYAAMRIDEKEFSGLIIQEITTEISDSIAMIADLTGNRGGVYYEAGIAKGLQLCNHPIQLILTCKREFFDTEKVHFDVSGDNIVLYDGVDDLQAKLKLRLNAILLKEN